MKKLLTEKGRKRAMDALIKAGAIAVVLYEVSNTLTKAAGTQIKTQTCRQTLMYLLTLIFEWENMTDASHKYEIIGFGDAEAASADSRNEILQL
ncbi:hypothetical protein L2E82_19896 [Cichorium intybus]|uniref:Uncharacterized protein n=1 Tax=Cichorium intybus TaxID=13427 RepID=A0ACB9DRG1_CICIN|nr:hypothetical protein L2E82_19896 [Cichorium intybus]